MRFRNALWFVGILFCVALCSCSISPQKEHTVTIRCYVNNNAHDGSVSISTNDIQASQSLVDTYNIILQSRSLLKDVIEESGCDYTYEELRSMIEVDCLEDSEVFEIRITAPNKSDAAQLADALVQVFQKKIQDILVGSTLEIVDIAY